MDPVPVHLLVDSVHLLMDGVHLHVVSVHLHVVSVHPPVHPLTVVHLGVHGVHWKSESGALLCLSGQTRIEKQFVRIFSTPATLEQPVLTIQLFSAFQCFTAFQCFVEYFLGDGLGDGCLGLGGLSEYR